MDVFLEYLRAFVCGGILCAIGQILIDRTPLTPEAKEVRFPVPFSQAIVKREYLFS